MDKTIAVLIPCFNEAVTIKKVIKDFKKEIPYANFYVYDNNSSDNTDEIARQAGAIVRYEYRQGKGCVMRTMFSEVDADIYILVDGDDTYPAESVIDMIQPILDGTADMVIGDRLSNGTYTNENKRNFHNFGNNLVKKLINIIFKADVHDIMTGYRVFNKKFIKNFPIMSKGFEIETEMTIHALDRNFIVKEIQINYRDRPIGSESKLNTLSDGIKVIKTIIHIFKDYKPLVFFGCCALFFALLGIISSIPVFYQFITTGLIFSIPLAILASSLEVIALLAFVCGLVLDTTVTIDKRNYEIRLIDFESRQARERQGMELNEQKMECFR